MKHGKNRERKRRTVTEAYLLCKAEIAAESDRPFWIKGVELLLRVDQEDFACRESQIKPVYLANWFYSTTGGERRFLLPAFYLKRGRVYFVNGRHRTALLLDHLDLLPMSLADVDVDSCAILARIVDKELDPEEQFELPDLPIVDSIS